MDNPTNFEELLGAIGEAVKTMLRNASDNLPIMFGNSDAPSKRAAEMSLIFDLPDDRSHDLFSREIIVHLRGKTLCQSLTT